MVITRYKIGQRHYNGFGLLELLVVMAIIGVIAAFAYSMMSKNFKKQESLTVRSQVETFLKQGRQSAIVYQKPINLCMVDISDQCVLQNGTSLLSFIDNNDNQQFDALTDTLLEKINITPKYGMLKTSFSLNKSFIQLSASTGLPLGHMGHIKYCPTDSNNDNKFKVSFSKLGIVKVKTLIDEAIDCSA